MAEIKVFKSVKQMNSFTKSSIENLLSQCEIVNSDNVYDYINAVDQKYIACVFDEHGEACGFAELEDEDFDISLKTLYVHPHDRNKGYASELLKCVQHLAKENKKDFIELVVRFDNENALNLYRKNKFISRNIISKKVVCMQKFSHNNNYIMGGILLEMIKNGNFDKNLTQNQYQQCYKYVKSKDKNKVIDNVLSLPYFDMAKKICEKYASGKISKEDISSMYRDVCLKKDLSKYEEFFDGDSNSLKKALVSVKAVIYLDEEKIIDDKIESLYEEVSLE